MICAAVCDAHQAYVLESTRRNARTSISFSSSVPTEMRRQFGRPNARSGRIMIPSFNSSWARNSASASVCRTTIVKFASDGTISSSISDREAERPERPDNDSFLQQFLGEKLGVGFGLPDHHREIRLGWHDLKLELGKCPHLILESPRVQLERSAEKLGILKRGDSR